MPYLYSSDCRGPFAVAAGDIASVADVASVLDAFAVAAFEAAAAVVVGQWSVAQLAWSQHSEDRSCNCWHLDWRQQMGCFDWIYSNHSYSAFVDRWNCHCFHRQVGRVEQFFGILEKAMNDF